MVLACEIPVLTLPPGVDGSDSSKRSFNFSKSPNLQEVDFRVGWVGGGLLWIPMALSTIKSTTSPRLSTIRLNFFRSHSTDRNVEPSIQGMSGDFQRAEDEAARIKREFGKAVDLTVLRDPSFWVVLDALNVRFLLRQVDNL